MRRPTTATPPATEIPVPDQKFSRAFSSSDTDLISLFILISLVSIRESMSPTSRFFSYSRDFFRFEDRTSKLSFSVDLTVSSSSSVPLPWPWPGGGRPPANVTTLQHLLLLNPNSAPTDRPALAAPAPDRLGLGLATPHSRADADNIALGSITVAPVT
eukprot:CAMPEP_0198468048 /NCGR_PEP_ID=MMETSP1456-20131121/6257_1 /TAXON_ID=1461544 ORGANISM="Unidentified sp., Strain RCC1871" /NCGR_SAMPLE_ID=MMETSP1456 /ASSEMBLY_ACC=CAM_ASM_001119 /LENGTH=157 /DNA_ID=CAMNT_0044194175 /DNA_START=143 /DNA_END=612 /DNA_ORIENTATION=+